ncbi:MAG: adenine deaminase [Thermosphaera sp.]
MKSFFTKYSIDDRKQLIQAAIGKVPADIVITGVNIVSVQTDEILENYNILVKGARIAGIVDDRTISKYVSKQTLIIDGSGEYVIPGFIDLHVHIESSLLDPVGFSKIVLKHGTTTVVADPHEIANVLGVEGVSLFVDVAKKLPLKILIDLPSCVPATDPSLRLETTPHELLAPDLLNLACLDNVIGLGEVMDYLSVVKTDDKVLGKIQVASEKKLIVNGHAPLLTGEMLNAYVSAGITSDHESTSYIEGLEKLRKGMWLYIREGSAWKDLRELSRILLEKDTCELCAFVSDDVNVYDLFLEGHMDRIVNVAIEYGLDPLRAIKYATFHPAIRLHLEDHIGLLAPGRLADIVFTKRIEHVEPHTVVCNGEIIYYKGELRRQFPVPKYPEKALRTVNIDGLLDKLRFTPSVKEPNGIARVNVISVQPGSALTKRVIEEMEVIGGEIKADPLRDIMYVMVADRHTGSGSFSTGFVKGLGFKAGAIAQTIAHDTHNLIVSGWNPSDMSIAVKEISRMQGGIVVVDNQKVLAEIPLRLAGLMSTEPPEIVFERYVSMFKTLHESYGLNFESYFMTLALISLPVIPEIRITDKGLVDVTQGRLIPLVEEVLRT